MGGWGVCEWGCVSEWVGVCVRVCVVCERVCGV